MATKEDGAIRAQTLNYLHGAAAGLAMLAHKQKFSSLAYIFSMAELEAASLSEFVGNSKSTIYNDRKPFIIPNSVNAVVDGSGKTSYVENTTFLGNPSGSGQSDVYYNYFNNPANIGSLYQSTIFDRSFLKLRDVNIAYRLPDRWASKIGSSNASISIYGRNFLLWVPKSNIYVDPESTNYGNDLTGNLGEFATGPLSKTYGVALKLTF